MKKLILFLLLAIPYLAISQVSVLNSGGVKVEGTAANQVLTWNGTTWVSTPITTSTITTGISGILKGNGTSILAAVSGTDYELPLTFGSGLTRTVNAVSNNLITGLAGGQTIIGGTASAENLTLSSTSNATKGIINFGTSSVFRESTGRWGINNLNPTATIHVNQASIAAVTTSPGTNAPTLITIVGIKGGNTSNSGSTVSAGNGGGGVITGGAGGDITGTPVTGFGGNGGQLIFKSGNGGNGGTNGGNGVGIELNGGDGGFGTVTNGNSGYATVKGGNGFPSGNSNGASVFLIGGTANGTGTVGNVYLGVSPSFTSRGSVKVGGSSPPAALLTLGEAGGRLGDFSQAGNTAGTVTFQPPASFTNYTITWPLDDGTPSQVLTTDGSGVLSWTTPSGSSGITSLGAQTGATQTFANGTAGLTPGFSSASNVHTLNIPLASTASVTAGLLSNSDYLLFATKVGKSSNGITNKVARWTSTTEIAPGSISDFGNGVTIDANNANILLDLTGTIGAVQLAADQMTFSLEEGALASDARTYFTDTRATTRGIEYFADYSAGYTGLSLVHADWVNAQIAANLGAPASAPYLTTTAVAGLSSEVDLGLQTTGFLYSTVSGVTATISQASTANLGTLIGGSTQQMLYYNGSAIAASSLVTTNNATMGIGQPLIGTALLRVGQATPTMAALKVEGQMYTPRKIVTYGTTTTIDWHTSNIQSVIFGSGNITTLTLSNPVDGAEYILILKQDAIGSRTITWPAAVKWPGNTAPTLTTTANRYDLIRFVFDGSSYYGTFTLNYQ